MSSPSSIQSESYRCSRLKDDANGIIYSLNANFNLPSNAWIGNSYQAFNTKFQKLIQEVKKSSDQFSTASRDLNHLADRVEEELERRRKKAEEAAKATKSAKP